MRQDRDGVVARGVRTDRGVRQPRRLPLELPVRAACAQHGRYVPGQRIAVAVHPCSLVLACGLSPDHRGGTAHRAVVRGGLCCDGEAPARAGRGVCAEQAPCALGHAVRLSRLVRRIHRHRWRVVPDVAVAALERSGIRVPLLHHDAGGLYLCADAGLKAMREGSSARRLRVDGLAGAEHDAVGLRTRQQFVEASGIEHDEVGRFSWFERGTPPHPGGGLRGDRLDPVGERVVEMGDPNPLGEHFQHVEIAVGVEGIAGVVARQHDGDAGRLQLVQQRDAAPARRAAGRSVLQIEVAQWQADDADARVADPRDHLALARVVLNGETAAMPAQDFPAEAVAQHGAGHLDERRAAFVAVLVDMQVDIEPVSHGERQEAVEPLGVPRVVKQCAAEQAAFGRGHFARDRVARVTRIGVEHAQRHGLQRDAVAPLRLHLAEQSPGHRKLRARRVEMGADRGGAMRIRATQRELHARLDVLPRPVRFAIGGDGGESGRERAVGIGLPLPDEALVEMGVDVVKGGQHQAEGEIGFWPVGDGQIGTDRADRAAVHQKVHLAQSPVVRHERAAEHVRRSGINRQEGRDHARSMTKPDRSPQGARA